MKKLFGWIKKGYLYLAGNKRKIAGGMLGWIVIAETAAPQLMAIPEVELLTRIVEVLAGVGSADALLRAGVKVVMKKSAKKGKPEEPK